MNHIGCLLGDHIIVGILMVMAIHFMVMAIIVVGIIGRIIMGITITGIIDLIIIIHTHIIIMVT